MKTMMKKTSQTPLQSPPPTTSAANVRPDPASKYTWEEQAVQSSEKARLLFENSDLNLSSFLRCRSFGIEDIRERNGRTIFVFEDGPELRRAIVDYANDGAVGVRSFCNTLRDLKGLTRDAGSSVRKNIREENWQ
jgi:hypothetical protein